MFVNARSDVFFQTDVPEAQSALLGEAVARGRAYAQAGADGVFLPGLSDPALIRQVAEATPAPINVMARTMSPDAAALASMGVARLSLGPRPYLAAMEALTAQARRPFAQRLAGSAVRSG